MCQKQKIEVISGGSPNNTKVLIDGKQLHGVVGVQVEINLNEITKVTLFIEDPTTKFKLEGFLEDETFYKIS